MRSSFSYGLKSDERLKRSENILEVCMRLGGKEKIILLIHLKNFILRGGSSQKSLMNTVSIRYHLLGGIRLYAVASRWLV